MGSFFKNIGKGIGYFFLFPGLIIAIALYAVFGLAVFVFQFFKLIFLFFSGRTLFSDLPEDIALKAAMQKDPEPVEEEKPLSLYPSDSIVYGSGYSSPAIEENKEENNLEVSEPGIEAEPEPTEEEKGESYDD